MAKRTSKPRQPPFQPLQDLIDEFGEHALTAMVEVTPVIAEILVAAVQDVFESEGFGKWPELADSTIAQRRGGPGQAIKILQDSGLLAGSINPESSPDSASAFTNVPYGAWHVIGTEHMPKRDFLEVDADLVQFEAAEVLLEAIQSFGAR